VGLATEAISIVFSAAWLLKESPEGAERQNLAGNQSGCGSLSQVQFYGASFLIGFKQLK
jgi:hypothetical protein